MCPPSFGKKADPCEADEKASPFILLFFFLPAFFCPSLISRLGRFKGGKKKRGGKAQLSAEPLPGRLKAGPGSKQTWCWCLRVNTIPCCPPQGVP